MDKELKNELRRDEVGDALTEARGFINRPEVMKPALAILALVLVILGLYSAQRFRASSAESAFLRASEVYHQETGANAVPSSTGENFKTDAEKFQKAKTMFDEVASSYSSQAAGRRAQYYSALCLAELGQLGDAQTALRAIAEKKDSNAIEPALAKLRIAELVYQGGLGKDAASFYAALVAESNSPLPKDRLLFGLGESQVLAGDKLAARRTFQDLVNRHPQSPYAADARQKVQELAAL